MPSVAPSPLDRVAPVALVRLAVEPGGHVTLVDANGLAAELLGRPLDDLRDHGFLDGLFDEDAARLAPAIVGATPAPGPPVAVRWGLEAPFVTLVARAQRHPDGTVLVALVPLPEDLGRDVLTGLPTRTQFNDRVEGALSHRARDGREVAILSCDIDRFSTLNEQFGHPAADAVLVEVGQRLVAGTRATDTVCRLGDDAFAVVCEAFNDPVGIVGLAERLIASVARPIEVETGTVEVGLSIGVAVADATSTVERLLAQAHMALHRAKELGGARAVVAY